MSDPEEGVILAPDGTTATVPTVHLTKDEARLLREYQKFLRSHRLREALYCEDCWDFNLHDGCGAAVTDHEILIKCRCKLRVHLGITY